MKRSRRLVLLLLLLAGGGVAWLVLSGLARQYERQGANYSRIEDGLYVGGVVASPPPGTGMVLNLCRRDDPFRTDHDVWEPIPDRAPAPDLAWLRRMVELIAARRREGVTVYIHCRNGVSRSGLVVVAYEMYKHHWTQDEALAFVRSQRPLIRPNAAFRARLLEWGQELHRMSAPEPSREE
jgi:hypothetical protein